MKSLLGLSGSNKPTGRSRQRLSPFLLVLLSLFPLLLYSPSVVHAGWVQQNSGTTAGLHKVFFSDSSNGWVLGDSAFVLRTTNGGQLWQRHTVDPSILGILCLWFHDSNLGWVVGAKDSSSRLINQVFTTTDGGIRWQAIYRDTMTSMSYIDIEFVTPLKGWLAGSQLYSNGTGKGYLFYTSDGGFSWALNDSMWPPGYGIYWDVSFADSLNGCLAVGNPGIDQSSGCIKKTTDGGLNWTLQGNGLTMYRWVRCLDCNIAWSVGYTSFLSQSSWDVSKTTNGGNSWNSIFYRNIRGIIYPPISLIDAQKGWIQTRDTLFGTRDGGVSWSSQVPPGPYKRDIFFTDSLNGWLVGGNGVILHTTDGGSGVWEAPINRFYPLSSNSCLTVVPNPFSSFAAVPGHSSDRFALYDISGRKVGAYKGDRVGEGLSPGVYFLRWEGENAKPVRIVKVR